MLNHIEQYFGSDKQVLKKIASLMLNENNTFLIDFTGEEWFDFLENGYISAKIFKNRENIKEDVEILLKEENVDTLLINECHKLSNENINYLLSLSKEKNFNLFFFTSKDPIDLNLKSTLNHNIGTNYIKSYSYSFESY